jgi:hypothetical protein
VTAEPSFEAPNTARRSLSPLDRVNPAPAPVPFVPMPRRTTHGGPFGPVVRAKLIREALARRSGW